MVPVVAAEEPPAAVSPMRVNSAAASPLPSAAVAAAGVDTVNAPGGSVLKWARKLLSEIERTSGE